jgi:hypothetical protein
MKTHAERTDDDGVVGNIDYFVEGRSASHKDVSGAQHTVVAESDNFRFSVHAFESRKSYLEFASMGRLSRYLCASIGRDEILNSMPRTDVVARHPYAASQIESEISRLRSGDVPGMREWRQAAQGTSILEGPLLGSIVLHENRDLSGSFVYIPHWWGTADFSSNHMNDRASCITLAGSFATVWEDAWFSGRKLDIFLPFSVGLPLWTLGWEDTISSAYAWGFW